jgi:4-amino-4-deoxy-L-arabinose transferase-like glycosyltransferase
MHFMLLAALTGLLYITNLGGYDLWAPDEPRFAQVAREMMQTGDYLVPRINGLPYTEKPPLLVWAQAALAIPFGDVTEWPARLPSALAGITTVLLTYLLVIKMHGRRTAFLAALILATTQRFWWQARFGQIDMLLTACVTTAFLCFWLWHKQRQDRYLVAFYLAMAAGAFAKGPPAVVFPLLMTIAFFWKRRGERKQLHLVLGLSTVAILVAMWLVPARMAISVETASTAGGNIATNMFRQTIGRFFFEISHANPPWYYLFQMPFDLFPWSLFLPWTLVWTWKHRKRDEEMRFLLSWILPAFIFFSICVGKRAIYLLPLYPAFAILLAQSIQELMDGERERWRRWTGVAWGAILLLVGVAPWALPFTEYADSWSNTLIVISVLALLCGAYTLWSMRRGNSRALPRLVILQSSALFLAIALVGFPIMNSHKSARFFCEPLRDLSRAEVDYDLYSFGFSREEYIYYAEHFHEAVPNGPLQIDEMKDLGAIEQVTRQSKVLRSIQKAVKDVPLHSISAITDEECQRLQVALEECVPEDPEEKLLLTVFESAMRDLLDDLLGAMESDMPTFIMTQEQDWRWVVALCPRARDLTILKDPKVGSRHVLLIANPSARYVIDGRISESATRPTVIQAERQEL